MEPLSDKHFPNNTEADFKWADINISMEEEHSFDISCEDDTETDYESDEPNMRHIPQQEIWNPDVLSADLQALPGGEKLRNMVLSEDLPNISTVEYNETKETAFLLSAWYGKVNVLRALLNERVSVNTTDRFGRSALHLASYAGHSDCVWFLLQNGANFDMHDQKMSVTPLHCAASRGHLSCLKLLIKYGAHVNVGIEKKSPLHYAVQSLAVDCVKELLENNAIPNTPQVFSEAPVHVAAALGNLESLKLLLGHGAAVNVQSGDDKLTPLHLAAEQGYLSCVQLLIEAGAMVNATNRKRQTPAHLAALSHYTETLELLLQKGANPNAADSDGRTPLHCSTVNVQRSCDGARILLTFGANPNHADIFGYTPVHLAALNEFSSCVKLLLQHGGDVTARTKGGISALNFITKKTPEVVPYYKSRFDNSIRLDEHDVGDVDCQLKFDFRILVPTMGNQETSLLTNFIEVGHKEVLEHPLCETFLLLKWRMIRKFFFFSLLYQTIFVVLLSFYVKGVYLKDCPSFRRAKTKTDCFADDTVIDLGYYMLLLNVLLMLKELFQIFHSFKTYILEWENFLQWTIILSVFCCVQPMYQMNIREYVYTWQHHVAAISIFLAWVELMMIVARFPAFGIYVQMFTSVSINFGKFMCAYFCLIMAFTMCFGVLFPNYPAFKDLQWVFIKVIIMMSGELEYEDVFFSDTYEIKYPYTAHLAYLVFVVLVTIILTNLLVGLAVSDIQGLQKSATLDGLVRQVKLMAHIESMLFSKLLKWVPPKIIKSLHRRALLLKSQKDWTLDVKPNDPRENKIPKSLRQEAYQLVLSKKEKLKGKSFRKNLYSMRNSCRYNSTRKETNHLTRIEEELVTEINKIIKQKLDKFSNKQLGVNNNNTTYRRTDPF